MPLYTYECKEHGEFDRVMFMSELVPELPCPECGNPSRRVIVLGHGGVQRKDPEWLRGVSEMFEMDGHRPLETIEDYRNFLKENPNIKPKESHPSLPSSVGDIHRPLDKQTRIRRRNKKAMELIRKDEAITVTTRTSA